MDVGKVNPLSPSTSDGPSFDQMLNVDLTKANARTLQDSSQQSKKYLEKKPSLKDEYTVTQETRSSSQSQSISKIAQKVIAQEAHSIPLNKPKSHR